MITKLAPTYYRKLQVRLTDIGRFRELPDWRKAFKQEWNRCLKVDISNPINPQYRPDPVNWICTCPYFVTSRFLVCKHLVQSVKPVDAMFFLEVKRNRQTPFWQHASLKPLEANGNVPRTADRMTPVSNDASATDSELNVDDTEDQADSVNEDPDGVIDTQQTSADLRTFKERLLDHARVIKDFAGAMEYQAQFNDHRFLQTVEREGGRFLRLVHNCLDVEKRFQSTRGPAPNTWESGMSSTMFYRARPAPGERDT